MLSIIKYIRILLEYTKYLEDNIDVGDNKEKLKNVYLQVINEVNKLILLCTKQMN